MACSQSLFNKVFCILCALLALSFILANIFLLCALYEINGFQYQTANVTTNETITEECYLFPSSKTGDFSAEMLRPFIMCIAKRVNSKLLLEETDDPFGYKPKLRMNETIPTYGLKAMVVKFALNKPSINVGTKNISFKTSTYYLSTIFGIFSIVLSFIIIVILVRLFVMNRNKMNTTHPIESTDAGKGVIDFSSIEEAMV